MEESKNYIEFIKHKGKSLSQINPGSDEFALTIDDTIAAIGLLRNSDLIVFGGDVLSEGDSGMLVYAYQKWGSEYHYLNWSCERIDNESDLEYKNKSYEIAFENIERAKSVSEQLSEACYIVLVVGQSSTA